MRSNQSQQVNFGHRTFLVYYLPTNRSIWSHLYIIQIVWLQQILHLYHKIHERPRAVAEAGCSLAHSSLDTKRFVQRWCLSCSTKAHLRKRYLRQTWTRRANDLLSLNLEAHRFSSLPSPWDQLLLSTSDRHCRNLWQTDGHCLLITPER